MRIPKKFGERTTVQKETKRKFILVFEGEKTEYQYFDGISKYKEKLDINSLVEIKALMRSAGQENISNPKRIVEMLIQHLEGTLGNGISFKLLNEKICDFIIDELEISKDSILNVDVIIEDLKEFTEQELKISPEEEISNVKYVLKNIETYLKRKYSIEKTAEQIAEYIKKTEELFDREIDKICIIVDRDKQSFKSEQYDYVLEQCRANGFYLFVSNPCFEFWLLLHYSGIGNIDERKLLKNQRVGSRNSKKYAEHMLAQKLIGYNKNALNFEKIKDGIDLAIEQEKQFCENIEKLKCELGTNVGLLITEMKKAI